MFQCFVIKLKTANVFLTHRKTFHENNRRNNKIGSRTNGEFCVVICLEKLPGGDTVRGHQRRERLGQQLGQPRYFIWTYYGNVLISKCILKISCNISKKKAFLHFQNLEYNFRLGQANFIQTFYGNVRTDSGQVLQVRTQKFSVVPPRLFIFTCYKIQRGRRDIACPDSFNSIFCLINLGIGNFMQKKNPQKVLNF